MSWFPKRTPKLYLTIGRGDGAEEGMAVGENEGVEDGAGDGRDDGEVDGASDGGIGRVTFRMT
jgi:hypothetical protein